MIGHEHQQVSARDASSRANPSRINAASGRSERPLWAGEQTAAQRVAVLAGPFSLSQFGECFAEVAH